VARSVALLAVALLAVACGSKGNGTLSHAELLENADAICAAAHAEARKAPTPRKPGEIVPGLNAALAIAQRELAQLRALKPSKDDARAYAGLLTRFERTIKLAQETRDAVKAKTALRAQVLIQAAVRSNTESQSYAGGFGLQVCSKPIR
jgi:hypothetical protein